METKAHHIIVGIATLLLLIAALAFSLWLAKADSEQAYKNYDVLFKEPVSGLTVGSPVQFNGISVGEVTQLSLDKNDARMVRARIRITAETPITKATKASRTLLNITGASGIALEQSVAKSQPINQQDGIPEIVAEPSELTQLRLNTEELFVSVSQVINNANRLFSENNMQAIESILVNIDTFSGELAEQSQNFASVLDNLQQSTKQLNDSLVALESELTERSEPLFNKAEETLGNLAAASNQLNELMQQNRGNIDAGMAGIAEVGPTLLELQVTLKRINAIAARFETEQMKEYQP
ncbi:phospholipid/cholesterol/gamma-HCH transport system substrate-binding protein [Pseudidiomarina maritima]|uniref:Phospholipid/cholesterol/gamma-HCH transport system substrate-binding protein n=1 Tax=Pseudidiomarina maritima TaxID=519453 RepID=A0A1I6G4Q8_9GAMM|nr:MlaD family protein [Pseudidiomarina maritima]SFR37100.1 phospholipid/cholesterol/gamma-HCH transport system substrate-binding protein [Pseudidiomarina maritima]